MTGKQHLHHKAKCTPESPKGTQHHISRPKPQSILPQPFLELPFFFLTFWDSLKISSTYLGFEHLWWDARASGGEHNTLITQRLNTRLIL